MAPGDRKGPGFEAEVAQLLRLRGYTVTQNELIAGTQIDVVARRNDPLDNICLLVECGDRESHIGIDMIKEKAAVLLATRDLAHMTRLLYVARRGFTAEAKHYAQSQPTITLLTLSELERQLVDFTPYVDAYCLRYESSDGFFREGNLFNSFVDPAAQTEGSELLPSLLDAARAWLSTKSTS